MAVPTQAMSYTPPMAVAQPMTQPMNSFVGGVPALPQGPVIGAPTVQPRRLTEGLPDPTAIETQKKKAYYKALDQQLSQATGGLQNQNAQYKQMIDSYSKMYKQEYTMSIDSQCQQQV